MADRRLKEDFRAVLQKARALGLTANQLSLLSSVDEMRRLATPSESSVTKSRGAFRCVKPSRQLLLLTAALSVATIFSVFAFDWPISSARLVSFLCRFDDVQALTLEPCLIAIDLPLMALVRPPVDCTICHNLTHVERVSRLSRELFEARYAYSGRPLIVTDAMTNWSAVGAFSFEFFRGIYSVDSPVLTGDGQQRCQFFPYQTSFRNLSEVFDMSSNRAHGDADPWYIGWSNCDGSAANVLRTYYGRPYFLPDEAESSKTDWIFMGSPGYGAQMHIDNVIYPSWQAQVTGTKLWTLEPPPECYFECPRSIKTYVHSGEMIVIDTNLWFHSTLIVGNEMSITIGSEYN